MRFYEVLAMNPNGTRDFGRDMKAPAYLMAIFKDAYKDLSNATPLAGMICELGGLPRLKSESKVDFVMEKTSERGDNDEILAEESILSRWMRRNLVDNDRLDEEDEEFFLCKSRREQFGFSSERERRHERVGRNDYQGMERKDEKDDSEQFKHVRERLRGFFRWMSEKTGYYSDPLREPFTSYLCSLYGILFSDTWRTAHSPEDEIIFLESFLKNEEVMNQLCNKYSKK